MKEYKSNSDAEREEIRKKRHFEGIVEGKRVSPKRNFIKKLITTDLDSALYNTIDEVMIPAFKDLMCDTIDSMSHMIFHGNDWKSEKRSSAVSKISYHKIYDDDKTLSRRERERQTRPANYDALNYDDIVYKTRGEAELIIDAMIDIIEVYGTLSILEMFDLSKIPNDNYTLRRYGWTDLRDAKVVRTRSGYILDLPKAIPLD